jgi:hypothetical protein
MYETRNETNPDRFVPVTDACLTSLSHTALAPRAEGVHPQWVNENARNCGAGCGVLEPLDDGFGGGGSLDTRSLGPCSAWSAGM